MIVSDLPGIDDTAPEADTSTPDGGEEAPIEVPAVFSGVAIDLSALFALARRRY